MPLAPTSDAPRRRIGEATELPSAVPVTARTVADATPVFLSCGLAGLPSAIPGRFSSSSLPPSFARGRRAAAFNTRRAAHRGTPAFADVTARAAAGGA